MFAWPGRASDAATIDAAVVGEQAPSNSDRGEGSSEHRTAEERRSVLCVAFVLRPHLLSPTGVLSPPSDETANYTNSYILAQPYKRRTQPRTLYYSTQPYIQCVFYDSCKAVTQFYLHFARSLVCTRTKCRVFLRFLHKSIFLVLNNV